MAALQQTLDAELAGVSLLRDNLRQQWSALEEGVGALEARKQELLGDHKLKGKLKLNVGGVSIWVKRSTLLIYPSKLAGLFSGRWDRRLLRDSKQRIFLDVNPICFRKIVEAHIQQLIASPGEKPALPVVPEELAETLTRLIDFFGLASFFTGTKERGFANALECSGEHICQDSDESPSPTVAKGGCKLDLPARSVYEVAKATCHMTDQKTVDVTARVQTFVDAEGGLSLMADSATLGVVGEVAELSLSLRPFDMFETAVGKLSAALQREQTALMRSRVAHQADIKRFEDEKQWVQYFLASDPAPEAPEVVELNVSGERICIKRSTIMLCSESALARQFDATVWTQGGSSADRDSDDDSDDEGVFIEQNAYCFRLILDQLRLIAIAGPQDGEPAQPLPPDPSVVNHEKANFEKLLHFYFPGVESFIKTKGQSLLVHPPAQSTILDSAMMQTISQMLPERYKTHRLVPKILRDEGFTVANFDGVMNGVGPFIVFIREANTKYVFGACVFDTFGTGGQGWIRGSGENFLFTLGNVSGQPAQLLLNDEGNGIHISSCGLHMGGDLVVFCSTHSCMPNVYTKMAPGYSGTITCSTLSGVSSGNGTTLYTPGRVEVYALVQ
jgi:hypothetical protein